VVLAAWAGTRVEEILSGQVELPVDYLQEHDEWVLVLSGGGRLTVGADHFDLGVGDWLLLPGGVPHRLEHMEPGTRWLAVHGQGPSGQQVPGDRRPTNAGGGPTQARRAVPVVRRPRRPSQP
jgi:cupin 2 domain-containing protein